MSVFPFFSRDFGGSVGIKNPCFFGGFPCLFPKNQGKEGQGNNYELSGTGDSQRDSHESIRANHSQLKPLFL